MITLPRCPFCGFQPSLDDPDVLYRVARNPSYGNVDEAEEGVNTKDEWVYGLHCPQPAGGCGASVIGWSPEEVIETWSTRYSTSEQGGRRLKMICDLDLQDTRRIRWETTRGLNLLTIEDVETNFSATAFLWDGTEWCFDENAALAELLQDDVLFTNCNWWRDDWPEEARQAVSLFVNCNDVFAWGATDAEPLPYDEIQNLYEHWIFDHRWGTAIWCAKQRNQLPQQPVCDDIRRISRWNLDDIIAEIHPPRPKHLIHNEEDTQMDYASMKNEDGYMVDPSTWTEDYAEWRATDLGIEMTDEHRKIVALFREFIEENGITPSSRVVQKEAQKRFGIDSKQLYTLFPNGPKMAAMVAGGIKPSGC